jgi:hypothetical protein
LIYSVLCLICHLFQIPCQSFVVHSFLPFLRFSVCRLFIVIQTLIHRVWWKKLLLLHHLAPFSP